MQAIATGAQSIMLGESDVVARRRHRVDEPHAVPDRRRRRALGPQDGQLHARRRDVSRRLHLLAVGHDHGRDGGGARARVRHHARGSRTPTRSRRQRSAERARSPPAVSRDEIAPVTVTDAKGRRRVGRRRRASAAGHDARGAAEAAAASSEASKGTPGIITAGHVVRHHRRRRRGGADSSATRAAARGLKPLRDIIGWASAGVDPRIMGIGPVPAMQKLLAADRPWRSTTSISSS